MLYDSPTNTKLQTISKVIKGKSISIVIYNQLTCKSFRNIKKNLSNEIENNAIWDQ